MDLKKTKQTKIFIALFTLCFIFSWLVVPIHLQGINHHSNPDIESNACCNLKESASTTFPGIKHSDDLIGENILECYSLFTHDERHCPICSLAQNKVLNDSIKTQIDVVAVEWLHVYDKKFVQYYSAIIESIRAPPLADLLS